MFCCVFVLGIVFCLWSRLSRSPSAFWWFTFLSGSVSMCCLSRVLLVLSFCSFGALPLETSCSWSMIWLNGCCCSKECGLQMLRVDGVVVCCTLSLPAGLFRWWWCRLFWWLVCLCSSWFALRYCSAFSICSGGSWVEGCLFDLHRESCGPIAFDLSSGASLWRRYF